MNWNSEDLKDLNGSTTIFSAKEFYCNSLPNYPSFIVMEYERGKLNRKVEYKNGEIAFKGETKPKWLCELCTALAGQ